MTNPFEDENGVYHVLVNEEGQHSLWPTFIDVPKGWTIIHKSDSRAACLEFINKHWTDMRPNSLIERMKQSAATEQQKENQPEGRRRYIDTRAAAHRRRHPSGATMSLTALPQLGNRVASPRPRNARRRCDRCGGCRRPR
jgi:MbtH protein